VELLDECLKLCGITATDYKKIGRAAYYIESVEDEQYVLKLQPPCGGGLSAIARRVFGGSLPFQNEYIINKQLLDIDRELLWFPEMINGEQSYYMLFEYIECTDLDRDRNRSMLNQWLLSDLINFNVLIDCNITNIFARTVLEYLERPVFRIVRQTITGRHTLFQRMNIIFILLKFYVRQKRLKPIMLHNDLSFSNAMATPNGGLLLIDFEDSIFENRLLLCDAVDLLFDRSNLTLDMPVLIKYWNILSSRLGQVEKMLNMKWQVRICCMRHIMNSIYNPDFTDAEHSRYRQFLNDVLLDNNNYDLWYENLLI